MVTAVVAVLLAAACTPSVPPSGGAATAPSSGGPSVSGPAPAPPSAPPGTSDSASASPSSGEDPGDGDPGDSLAGWTLEQQVGQVFMVGVDTHTQQDASWAAVSERHVGNVFLAGRSQADTQAVLALVESFTDLVGADTTHDAPMLVATDQEGGNVQVLGGPGFSRIPSALDQSRLSPADLEGRARAWGAELADAGVTLNLAPVMDLVDAAAGPGANPPIGQWDRQYGSEPELVATHANAFARGMRRAGVASAIKHFPGLGRVAANTDTSADVTDTVTVRDDAAIDVFAQGIQAGAEVIMMSSAVYRGIDPEAPAVFSPVLVGDVLRGDLGFDGVVMTDDLSAAAQVQAWTPGERAVAAIEAGCDLVLASARPEDVAPMVDAVVARAREDPDFATRVREAATRVVQLKQDMSPGSA